MFRQQSEPKSEQAGVERTATTLAASVAVLDIGQRVIYYVAARIIYHYASGERPSPNHKGQWWTRHSPPTAMTRLVMGPV